MQIEACLLRPPLILGLAPAGRCDQDDLGPTIGTSQALGHVDPAETRHSQIEEASDRTHLACELQSLKTVVRDVDLESVEFQQRRQ